jgi:hypothetical protein
VLRALAVVAALLGVAGVARAEPRRVVVETPPEAFTAPTTASQVSPYLYLNRCTGGCAVTGGTSNDASQLKSSIPAAGTFTVQEFANAFGQTGSAGTCTDGTNAVCGSDGDCGSGGPCETADSDWQAVLQCMQEVYSPYAITVSDQLPASGSYDEALIAGYPADIGQAADVLGIAPLASNCSAQDDALSFTFANHHAPLGRTLNICWTAAQESAHVYGLDHEYQFLDGTSACNDPMTYRTDCGGEKFFRNASARCGEYAVRTCKCTADQNSHQKLLTVFGEGQSTIPAPTVAIVFPTAGTQLAPGNAAVHGTSGSQRGVAKVELWLNGAKWSESPGGAFGLNGQPDPSAFTLTIPATAPPSTIDIVVKAYDDLGLETDSAPVTAILGQPCVDASTCAQDQMCSNGRCFWNPPTAEIGTACGYDQFCTTYDCLDVSGNGKVCTQECSVNDPGSCPSGWTCGSAAGAPEVCIPPASGGCCSVGDDRGAGWRYAGLAALVVGSLRRRRPRGRI